MDLPAAMSCKGLSIKKAKNKGLGMEHEHLYPPLIQAYPMKKKLYFTRRVTLFFSLFRQLFFKKLRFVTVSPKKSHCGKSCNRVIDDFLMCQATTRNRMAIKLFLREHVNLGL